MEDQFAALHENPDMWVFSFLTALYLRWNCTSVTNNPDVCSSRRIIGTPGRLMHVVQEMNLKLQNVEYVVFDEADRWEHDHRVCIFTTVKNLPGTSVNTCSFSTQAFWNGFRWTASGNHPQTPRQQTDAAVLGHAAQVTGGVRPSRYCLITVSVMTQSFLFFFINSMFQNDFVIFQVWLNRCWSVWMWILNSVT